MTAVARKLVAPHKGATELISHLVLGDCLDWMRSQSTKGIDLIITDPPYGLGIGQTGHVGLSQAFTSKSWDAQRPQRVYFNEMRRVSRHEIIWCGNYFADYLPPSKSWLVWWKNAGLPRHTFADCELAWTSFNRPAYGFNSRWRGGIKDSKEPRYPHPTQKPLSVMTWCVEVFSDPGCLIVDPFLGTGTTALAAISLGRRCIGIEKDPEYLNIACRRLPCLKWKGGRTNVPPP